MTQDHEKLTIDSALRRLMGHYTSKEGGDYAGFLDKLAEHDANNIVIDEVLETKLEKQATTVEHSWKSIIALIWYRRIRNTAFIILSLSGLTLGFHNIFDRQEPLPVSVLNSIPAEAGQTGIPHTTYGSNRNGDALPSDTKSGKTGYTTRESLSKQGNSPLSKHKDGYSAADNYENNRLPGNDDFPIPASNEQDVSLGITGFSHLFHRNTIRPENFSNIALPEVKSMIKKQYRHIRSLPKTGYMVSLHLVNSFQSTHSEMISKESGSVNRNYEALSNNGRQRSHVLNYGVSIEKYLFGGLSASAGISKFTLRQQQQTDFLLTEVPIYNIDGSIVGYFNIPPERIQLKLDNQVDYISAPLNLIYGLKTGMRSSMQFRLGSAILYQAGGHTQKFDYTTLDLAAYNQHGRKLSFSNFQYGLSYTRTLKDNLQWSIGIERQMLYRINALSDHTEKVRSTLNNLTISLQYKL